MPGFASIEVSALPLTRDPVLVGIYRFNPTGLPKYQLLPNVRVLSIHRSEGAEPSVARFRYVFNPADPTTDPISLQEALSVETTLANVVKNDDRLVVLKYNADGSTEPLFDGFADAPELHLTPAQELVTFLAHGVEVREWDNPIGGSLIRNSDDPTVITDVETDLLTYFNPAGQPNATPENADSVDHYGHSYPVFLDPLVVRSPDFRRSWTLPMAIRHLFYRNNPTEAYVKNPDSSLLDTILDSRSPIGGVTVNPGDPSTYKSNFIVIPDYLASGKPWPVAVHQLLQPNGFGMVFRLEVDLNGDPVTRLDIFRRQDGSTSLYKDLYLQSAGGDLDATQTNLAQARLVRDTTQFANTYTIETTPIAYEASFVLSPGFAISQSDAQDALAIKAFDKSNPSFSKANRDKYRLYVFDETGEGHWDFKSASLKNSVTPLDGLLGGKNKASASYVRRRRVPKGELHSTDSNRKPLKARLAISTDYAGLSPGLWDGSGTWQSIVGGFELLQDRLGIWINVPNPNAWHIGLPSTPLMPYPSGVVKGVEDQANVQSQHFYLRLTCVIEGDNMIQATANARPSSTSTFTVKRLIDASSRFFKKVITAGSEFNSTVSDIVVRDDTSEAQAEVESRRLARECGTVAGSATIPRFTSAYRIGDRIRSILGRNLSLRTNSGAPAGEGEVFPAIVTIDWEFERKQSTTLQLSDHRGEY